MTKFSEFVNEDIFDNFYIEDLQKKLKIVFFRDSSQY